MCCDSRGMDLTSGYVALSMLVLLLTWEVQGGALRWTPVKDHHRCGERSGICYSCLRSGQSSLVLVCVHHHSYTMPCSQPGQECRVLAPCRITCQQDSLNTSYQGLSPPPSPPVPTSPAPTVTTAVPTAPTGHEVSLSCSHLPEGCHTCDPARPSMIFTCDSHHSDDVTPGKALRSMRCHAGQVCSLARGECSARCAPQSEMLPPPVTLREEGCSQPSPMLAMKKNISKTKLITDDSVPEVLSCQSRHLCQLCSPGDSRLYTCWWSSSYTGGLILEPRPRGCPAGTRCAPGSAPCSASCVSTDVTETSQRPHSNSQLPGAALQEQHLKSRDTDSMVNL